MKGAVAVESFAAVLLLKGLLLLLLQVDAERLGSLSSSLSAGVVTPEAGTPPAAAAVDMQASKGSSSDYRVSKGVQPIPHATRRQYAYVLHP
jgi:hypothetical protein